MSKKDKKIELLEERIKDLENLIEALIEESDELEVSLESAQVIIVSLDGQNDVLTETLKDRDTEIRGLSLTTAVILSIYSESSLSPTKQAALDTVMETFIELKEALDGQDISNRV